MVGGKQKRAAKYKRWILSQIKHSSQKESDAEENHDCQNDTTSSATAEVGPIPWKIRQEVLKHRQRKAAKRFGKDNWITRKLDRFCRAVEHWPSWPLTFVLLTSLYILVFFLIRSLIQLVTPEGFTSMDRTHLYYGLKNVAPRPIYKMILLMDYLFTARELSFQGIYRIIYPPEEYYQSSQGHVPHSQFYARS